MLARTLIHQKWCPRAIPTKTTCPSRVCAEGRVNLGNAAVGAAKRAIADALGRGLEEAISERTRYVLVRPAASPNSLPRRPESESRTEKQEGAGFRDSLLRREEK